MRMDLPWLTEASELLSPGTLHTYVENEHPNKAGGGEVESWATKGTAKGWGLWVMILCLTGLRQSLSKVEVSRETESKSSHWDVSSW